MTRRQFAVCSFAVPLLAKESDKFEKLANEYIAKLKPESGVHRDINENGDFDARRSGKLVERRELVPALKAPSWLDPRTGGPRL